MFVNSQKAQYLEAEKICKAMENFIILISKIEEGKGLYPSFTEVTGNFNVFALIKLDLSLKTSLASPYYMRNVAQEKGKGQTD